jgi:hypothetical protein
VFDGLWEMAYSLLIPISKNGKNKKTKGKNYGKHGKSLSLS